MARVKSIARDWSMIALGTLCLVAAACEPSTPPAAPPPALPAPPPAAPMPPPAATPMPVAPPAPVEPTNPTIPAAIVVKDAAIKTPESVLYDAEADVYWVSNINGKPTEADDNGVIIKIAPDGKVIDANFIDGAKKEIQLNAPKGMAIVGDTLFVADLDVVRMFDKMTGKSKGEIKAPKSTFLNDITADAKGKLFVSDSGLMLGKGGLEPDGSDALFSFDAKSKTAKVVSANKELMGPNGLLAAEDGVWTVTFRGNELYHLSSKGVKAKVTVLPKGSLDGIVKLADGTLLISSWEAQSIYRGRPGGTFEAILTGITSPADIGLDTKRNRVLIPSFQTDTVIIQPLPELPAVAEPAPATEEKAPATPVAHNAKLAAPAEKPAAAAPKMTPTPAAPKPTAPTAPKK